jgi:hypothetical protein
MDEPEGPTGQALANLDIAARARRLARRAAAESRRSQKGRDECGLARLLNGVARLLTRQP